VTADIRNEAAETEDSDDWLNVDAEDFEDVLGQRMGIPKDALQENVQSDNLGQDTSEDQAAHDQASKLRNLAHKVEAFVEGEGDLEGAMFKEFVLTFSVRANQLITA
jgi:hypothetical protein